MIVIGMEPDQSKRTELIKLLRELFSESESPPLTRGTFILNRPGFEETPLFKPMGFLVVSPEVF